MKVKRIGSYSEVDGQGFLQSRANLSTVKGPWLHAVEEVKEAYLDKWKGKIHSIYVRGSLAKGLATENFSDIDSFAVLNIGHKNTPLHDDVGTWAKMLEQSVQQKFPFVAGVEVDLEPFEWVQNRENPYAFIIKIEAVCVYGEHLAQKIEPFRPNPEIAFQTRYFRQHLQTFLTEYPNEPEHEKAEFLGWMTRRFLRLGMQFVMLEEQRYTRDLYLCYESFAKHYPEKATEMYRALELSINPTSERATEVFVKSFGAWLAEEAERKLSAWDYVQNPEGGWVHVSAVSKDS